NVESTKIVLLEAGDCVLQSFSAKLSQTALAYLQKMGVEVRLNTRVTGLADGAVRVGDHTLHCGAVVWAAGVEASELGRDLRQVDKADRVVVKPDSFVAAYPNIFVCGDMAAVAWRAQELVPGQAPCAIQMRRHAARNI